MTSMKDYSGPLAQLFSRWAFVPFALALTVKTLYFNWLEADPQPGDQVSLLAFNLLVFTSVALLLPGQRNRISAQLDILGTLIIQIDLLYFRMFNNLPSVNILGSVENVGYISKQLPMLFNPNDLLLYLDIPLIAFYCIRPFAPPIRSQRVMLLFLLGMSVLATRMSVFAPVTGLCSGYYRLGSLVTQLGVVHYHIQDICKAIKRLVLPPSLAAEDKHRLDAYLAGVFPHHNAYTGKFAGSNILLIQVEALQSFVIERSVNGQPITPNLNRLVKESLWFTNFYHQTGIGRTSDAEFLTQTALFARRFRLNFEVVKWNHFFSLATMLHAHGYDTLSMHGNSGAFYNRRQMHHNLGFVKTYFRENLRADELLSSHV